MASIFRTLSNYPSPLNSRTWPAAACAADALRLLASLQTAEREDDGLAVAAALASPWLSLQLLAAAPDHSEKTSPHGAMSTAMRGLGKDLLTAWALLAACGTEGLSADRIGVFAQFNRHSLTAAHLAQRLAGITRLCHPDHAYLAGLWHNLGQLKLSASNAGYPGPVTDVREVALAAGELKQYGETHTALAARMVQAGFPLPLLAEAIEVHHAPIDFVNDLPGLPRVLRATIAALSGAENGVAEAASMLNLNIEEIRHSVDAVGHVAADITTTPASIPLPVVMASTHGLIRAAFAEMNESVCAKHLALACRLLAGRSAPLILQAHEGDVLRPLTECSPRELLEFTAINDQRSLCMQALAQDLVRFALPIESGSAADWLMARQLGGIALECVPWRTERMHGVAVFVHDTVEANVDNTTEQILLRHTIDTALGAYERARTQRLQVQDASNAARQTEQHAARRIAHEVSNPLSIIGNYLSIIERQQKGTPELAKQMALMHAEIGRAQRLMKKLGRPMPVQESVTSSGVNEILFDIRALYEESLFGRRNIKLDMQLAVGLPRVSMNSDALRQVLLNLLLNAAEALEDGGTVIVNTNSDLNFDNQPWVEVRVKDDGAGIPRSNSDRLDLPGVSSKGSQHSGVGLAVSRDLVKQCGGHLLCRSHSGTGTTFSVLLPLL